ncbi:branched-chain amino acid transport system carrier protein [Cutibacterium acnes JCM 18918]|nr:branched-chain amino acid transport system carrier protein [Cutibacterium acnes JCM 18918]
MFLYPLAITAIILGLLDPWLGASRLPHRIMTGCVVLAALPDLVRALPIQGQEPALSPTWPTWSYPGRPTVSVGASRHYRSGRRLGSQSHLGSPPSLGHE